MESYQSLEWDRKLKKLFDEVDDFLEDKYGSLYPLHPNRMKRGETANKEMDGLFNVGASFSLGYGTEFGRGYVIDLHLSTLSRIDSATKDNIEKEAIDKIKGLLPKYFSGREIYVKKDGCIYKICGDLSLGSL